jgi:hypothetical protein
MDDSGRAMTIDELLSITRALAHALDPAQALQCVSEAFACIKYLQSWVGQEFVAERANPALNAARSAIMRWISHPDSTSIFARMSRCTCTCSTDERQRALHRAGDVAFEKADCTADAGGRAALFVTGLFILMVKPETGTAFLLPSIRNLSSRHTWPTSIEDIMPHGPDDTVRGLLAWYKPDYRKGLSLIPELGPMTQIVQMLMRYTHPMAIPSFAASGDLIRYGVIDVISAALSTLRQAPKGRAITRPLYNNGLHALHDLMVMVATLTVLCCNRPKRRRITQLYRRDMVLAYEGVVSEFDRLYARTQDHNIQGLRDQWAGMAARLVADHPDLHNDMTISEPTRLKAIAVSENLWMCMVETITSGEWGRRCASADCPRTFADPVVFRLCGGCRRVRYCSKGCQKAAWKHHTVPHRGICAVIHHMCSTHGISRTITVVDMSALTASEPASFDRRSAHAIVYHFSQHASYRMRKWRT